MSQTDSRNPAIDDVTVLSRNTEITGGKLTVAHDLTVRGVIEGEVRVGGKVVVAAGARVIGMLEAREAIVAGSVQGEVVVAQTLTLRSTAVVDGGATAARLIVEEGSSGNVKLRIGDQKSFELLDRRRHEARAELERIRSRPASNGRGSDERATGEHRKDAPDKSWSTDDLIDTREMREILPGDRPAEDAPATPVADPKREQR